MSPAKTNAERQYEWRQRQIELRQARTEQGLKRLELFAHPDDWPDIKKCAEKLQRKRAKQIATSTD